MKKLLNIRLLKVLSLLFLLLLLLSSIYYYINNDSEVNSNITQNINVLGETNECNTNSFIDYYTYKDEPDLFSKNNKYGIYVYAEYKDYLEFAQNLVNSNGGEWGYVLIPYNVKDRDYTKWNDVFKRLSNKQLIPVIQLHDIDVDAYKKQTLESAKFLNSFMWPIRPRYISVYNEMNDSKFWYGYVDPVEYAEILDYTIMAYKNINSNFQIMNGAFNVSAANNGDSMDSFLYMSKMNDHIPGIFNKLDAWASHPYPQPNFSGSPYNTGRWSIQAYDNELKYLKENLGVNKELPVFITETGWAHAEGENYNSSFLDVNTISEYFKIAYQQVWLKDVRVRAVMPFTIRYKAPFDHFSWIDKNEVPYKHYETIKSLPKVKGEPPILVKENYKSDTCL